MRTFEKLLFILCLLGMASGLQAVTFTITPSSTASATPTLSRTNTPTYNATQTWPSNSPTVTATQTGPPNSPTVTATQTGPPNSPTQTGTTTRSGTVTATPSRTATNTPTRTVTPTPSRTPTPPGAPAGVELIDDFEDNDLIGFDGGAWTGISDGGGSTVLVELAGGCGHGTVLHSGRCHGSCSGVVAGSWAGMELDLGGPRDCSTVAAQARSLAFRLRGAAAGLTLTVQVIGGGTVYEAVVPLSGTSWADITVALPDNEAAEGMPQLAFVSGVPAWSGVVSQVSAIRFILTLPSAGSAPYDILVDDLRWGAYSAGASDSQLADALSVSLSWVQAARTYGLSDDATWILLVLARHCGCHPSTVLAQRATMSWGQICLLYGLTWEQCVDEAWDLAEAAGLRPGQPQPDQVLRDLRNSLPVTDPLPTVTPYVPLGPIALPPAGGC